MIAKNIKGKSFKGCVSYVMNDSCEILEAEGVLADSTKDMIRSFAIQRSGRKEIKQPVGHIPISFAPEDSPRMTNDFMLQLAKEYMLEMGIKNTQYIIVRHHNTDNDHLHIVYNRINNDLKLISVNNDYKRNIKVCKELKDKYNLTYGKGKERVKREKLNDPDKAKYKIYDAIKLVLPHCKTPADLRFALQKHGIEIDYKHKRTTNEIEGVSFQYNNISFKGSQVDRKYSYGNLEKVFEKNIEALKQKQRIAETIVEHSQEQIPKEKNQEEKQAPKVQQQAEIKPKTPSIGGVQLTPEQWQILKEGKYIHLENMNRSDGNGKFSSYVFLNDEGTKAFFSNTNPDSFVQHGKYEMRIRDKIQIEKGHITKAKVKWWGGGFAHPYLWKENKTDTEYKEAWGDPRIPQTEKIRKEPKTPTIVQKKNRGMKW